MDKETLRKAVLERRQSLRPSVRAEKSLAIARRLMGTPWYQEAKRLMVYVDFRNEVQTSSLIAAALAGGKEVAVPLVRKEPKGLLASLVTDFPGDLAPGVWGILEPRPETLRPVDPATLDLVLVPGAAFDSRGNRLGYGGGYYDRFLPALRPDALKAALAYDLQVVDRVPTEPFDIPMDAIITESRLIKCGE